MSRVLSTLLGLNSGDKVALVGCSGKTTTMFALAKEQRDKTVLVTTTTKIAVPKSQVDRLLIKESEIATSKPQVGITCVGRISENKGKLSSIPNLLLHTLTKQYDYCFIEADGSAGLPLKGWETFEPVVPNFISKTIGVVSLKGLGQLPSDKNTHRLPLFLQLTGLQSNQTVQLTHLAKMITEPKGMFKNVVGVKILLINQVKRDEVELAKNLVQEIKKQSPKLICKFIVGFDLVGTYKEIE